MRRFVYIGGIAMGNRGTAHVTSALEAYYGQRIEAFTLAHALRELDTVCKAVQGAHVITHSSGMLALQEAKPLTILAFDPPLPTPRLTLIMRSGLKTMRMHTPGIGLHAIKDIAAVSRHNNSATAELLAHPLGNFGHIGRISQFDAIEAAIAAQQQGIAVSLVYTHGDEYFHLSKKREAEAQASGVTIVRLPGVHDELILRPTELLSA
jgi:hypothetical protein